MEAGRIEEGATLAAEPLFSHDAFAKLTATPDQRQAISDMMTTLANTPVLFLMGKRSYLRQKGEETHGVNTLKFLEIILNDTNPNKKQNLRRCLLEIRRSHFKWDGFLNGEGPGDGIAGALNKLADENKLNEYLPGFYKAVKVDSAKAQPFLLKREWGPWMDVVMGYNPS